MKTWFAFFFLLITVAGVILPCCNLDDGYTGLACDAEPEEKSEAACSPFFACGTCTGFVQVGKSILLPTREDGKIQHYSKTLSLIAPGCCDPLFQPPRLG